MIAAALAFQTTVNPNAFAIHWKEIALGRSLRLLAVLVVIFAAYRVTKFFVHRYISKQPTTGSRADMRHQQQVRTLLDLTMSAITAIVVAFAVILSLDIIGVNIYPFAAAAGLISLAIGFGGQYLVRDLINGAVIIFEDQYVVGDNVKLGDLTGRVEHLTLRRTVLRADTGALISIPNGGVANVINMSRDWAHFAVDVVVPADHAVTQKANAALQEVAKGIKDEPELKGALVGNLDFLGVEIIDDKSATLRLEGKAAPERRDDVIRDIRTRVREKFASDNIALNGVQVTS
jgi:moderate conductance mechanosensitive channel